MREGQWGGNRKPKTIKQCETCNNDFIAGRLKQRFCSNECKVKTLRGKNHPRWQGGKSLETQRARAKTVYKKWREAVFKRDNYTCQKCKRRSKKGERIEINAHHIEHLAINKEKRYDINNGVTLCVECHRKEHFGDKAKKLT